VIKILQGTVTVITQTFLGTLNYIRVPPCCKFPAEIYENQLTCLEVMGEHKVGTFYRATHSVARS